MLFPRQIFWQIFIGLGNFIRRSNDEITFFKNGGGAHLDLIVAKYILTAWEKNKYLKVKIILVYADLYC